jgi:hypothetical protein
MKTKWSLWKSNINMWKNPLLSTLRKMSRKMSVQLTPFSIWIQMKKWIKLNIKIYCRIKSYKSVSFLLFLKTCKTKNLKYKLPFMPRQKIQRWTLWIQLTLIITTNKPRWILKFSVHKVEMLQLEVVFSLRKNLKKQIWFLCKLWDKKNERDLFQITIKSCNWSF